MKRKLLKKMAVKERVVMKACVKTSDEAERSKEDDNEGGERRTSEERDDREEVSGAS